MTTLRIMLSMLAFVTVAAPAQTRFNNDPGVSVHNYKHPHKAKQAAGMKIASSGTMQASQPTQAVTDMRQTTRNYKGSNLANRTNDALVVLPGREMEYTPNPLMAKENYKRQHRPATPAKTPVPARPAEELAEGEKDKTKLPD